MSDRGHCLVCGKRTRNRDDRGFVCSTCAREGGDDGEEKEAHEEEAQAGQADAGSDVLVGEFAGVRYEAGPGIPRGEIVFLANKLGSIVRGRVLKGELTMTFPAGPGAKR